MRRSFSVIIPVINEATTINRTVEQVCKVGIGHDVEIIIVDGDEKGETLNAVRGADAIKLISQKGRSRQMNKGASVAEGDILLFLHSDTELPGDAFGMISLAMKDQRYVGGAFDLGINSERPVFRLIEKLVFLRSRLTKIPYGDQAIFLRRDFFKLIKGFTEIPIMEDVELMRRVKRLGKKICIISEKVKTSPRRWEKEGILYCTLRNWTLISLYLLGVSPEKLVKYYYPQSKG